MYGGWEEGLIVSVGIVGAERLGVGCVPIYWSACLKGGNKGLLES